MISGQVSINKGLKGPNIAVTTACTTGTHSIGLGARMIQYGDADVMFVGGAEKASTEMGMGGFGAARALSTRNDSPETAPAEHAITCVGSIGAWPTTANDSPEAAPTEHAIACGGSIGAWPTNPMIHLKLHQPNMPSPAAVR